MKWLGRKDLKDFFRAGKLPDESHFEALIDSTLNLEDERFSWKAANGFEVGATTGDKHRLISFFGEPGSFEGAQETDPDWSITAGQQKSLNFVVPNAQGGGKLDRTVLSMTAESVGVHGALRSVSRIGVTGEAAADGTWTAITGRLTACHAFEVVAVVGKNGTGHHAILHAHALNAYNPSGFLFNFLNSKKRIRCHHAWYLSRGDRLQLEWNTLGGAGSHEYELRIRTTASYRDDQVKIRYSITDLWPDPVTGKSAMFGPERPDPLSSGG